MARRTPLSLFLGADRLLDIDIRTSDESAAVDITGWALSFMIKRHAADPDTRALVTKTTAAGIAIAGTFNASVVLNAQLATVTIDDTDTDLLQDGVGEYELKRTDAGFETVLVYGPVTFVRAVHGS